MREIEIDARYRENQLCNMATNPQPQRVLLIYPPIYDVRLYWARFQQPTYLLQIATHFRQSDIDVRLLDAMNTPRGERLAKKRVSVLNLDGIAVNKWRFGLDAVSMNRTLIGFSSEGWKPDEIFVECAAPFWWEGAVEAIERARTHFPDAKIVLVGDYALTAPEHARRVTGCDVILSATWDEVADLTPDYSVYSTPPNAALVPFGDGHRSARQIVDDIAEQRAKHRIQTFAFHEYRIASRFPRLFQSVHEEIIARGLDVTLHALGAVALTDITSRDDLAGLMRRAGHKQIYFADDRDSSVGPLSDDEFIETCRVAAELFHDAGFPHRSQELLPTVSLGRQGEDLAARARLATLVAHHMGSVVMWPYQPSTQECPHMPLENQNGKLFPLRSRNGATYRDYMEVLGLATVLNAKYRTKTFDFLGEGLIPTLFRDSIAREAWEPDPSVKGTLILPVAIR